MSLTTTSANFRSGVKMLVIFVVVYYFITLLFFPQLKNFWRFLNPPKDTTNPVYGLLDPLEFSQKALQTSNPTFVLNTRDGRLPSDLPDKMTVYKFKPAKFSYQAGKDAKDDASTLGFKDSDLTSDLKGNTYSWRNIISGSALSINIDTRELKMSTQLIGKQDKMASGRLNQDEAIRRARSVLTIIKRLDDPLYSNSNPKVVLGKFSGNAIIPTEVLKEAQLASVDFFRQIKGVPILGSDPKRGLIRVYISSSTETFINNPLVEYNFWDIDTLSNATYPISPIEDVWAAVSKGTGVIANVTSRESNAFQDYKPVKVDRILINDIYLAYYETPKFQKFLQPIYVFEGNYSAAGTTGGEITIYYPAVIGSLIKQNAPNLTETNK